MDAINYSGLNINGRDQFGSDKKAINTDDVKKFDLTDGLTQKELEKIDKNKDGAISEEEFKQAFGGSTADSYKTYWDSYKSFYNTTSKKTNGETITTQTKEDGTVITSKFDKDGKMVSYTEKKVNNAGTEEITKYENIDGKQVATKNTITYPDGTIYSKNLKNGTETRTSEDGSSIKIDKNGNILEIKTAADNYTQNYSFKYDKKGKLTSIEINGKKYEGVTTSEDGKIKDKDGNLIAKLTTDGSGNAHFYEYKNGKKANGVEMNTDGYIENISKYDKDGKLKNRFYCASNISREYYRDEKGKLTHSIDTRDGKKYSMQTYSDKTEKDLYGDTRPANTLWESRTFYDENGNVKSKRTYSYEKSGDNVKQTTTYYDADESTVKKTVVTEKDKYTNTLTKETYDKNGTETSSAKYEYDTNKIDSELTDKRIKSITTETSNETTVKKYTDGVVTEVEHSTIKDGIGRKEKIKYTYYSNGQEKEAIKQDENGKTIEIIEYNKKGEKTSQRVDISSYLKELYPELSDYQIRTLIKKCKDSSGNNFTSNSMINYDINNSAFDINIPDFTLDGYLLKF